MPSLKKDVILDSLADIGTIATGLCIIRPLRLETLQFYKLLFFGNLEQDFTEFVLNDLGVTRYEQYPLQPESAFFENRWMVEKTMELYSSMSYPMKSLLKVIRQLWQSLYSHYRHGVTMSGLAGDMIALLIALPGNMNGLVILLRHSHCM